MNRRTALIVAALVALIALVVPAAVGAQDERRASEAVYVDATNSEAVSLVLRSDAPPDQVDGIEISENGTTVELVGISGVPAAQQNVVLLIDSSEALDGNGGLVASREAAKAFVAASTGQQIAVYSFSDRVRRGATFTDDKAVLTAAIDDIAARPEARLWDGIAGASRVVSEAELDAATIIVLTGTPDEGSTGGSATARGSVIASGARLSVVGLDTPDFGSVRGDLQRLADETGGVLRVAPDSAALEATLDDARIGAANLYRASYTGVVTEGLVVAQMRLGGETVAFEYGAGAIHAGPVALEPTPPAATSSFGFLSGSTGLLIGIVLTVVAVTGIMFSLIVIFTKDNELTDVLSMYTDGYEGEDEAEDGAIRSAIVQRAVDITEQVAENQGLLAKAELMLEQAKLPLRAAEALFLYFIVVLAMAVVGLVMIGGLVGLLFLGVIGAMIPPAALNFRAEARKKRFVSQLPDMLQLLAGTLRAGFSLMQGVEAVSQEVDGPMGDELQQIVAEARLGRPLEEALEGSAERMESQDFSWAVMAIGIQREVGGNLSELLLTVADTMVQRERLRGEIAALTAEGKISAIVLGIMPPGLGVVMYSINPDYTSKLFTTGLGNFLLGLSFVSAIIGFVWMNKIIKIDI